MKIYIIRHGETDWNRQFRLQGRSDIPLNEEGKRLAELTAKALINVPFSAAYTSPLKRAKQTAKIILGERKIPLTIDDRLCEISFGEYEGLISKGENYQIPNRNFDNFFIKPRDYIPPKNGESLQQLILRTTEFLSELVTNKKLEHQTVLISTHGAAVRGLLSGINMDGIDDFWHGKVHKNCGVTVLESENGKIKLISEGVTYY